MTDTKRSFWDEWRGTMDGRPTLWVKNLLRAFGCRVDIHKIVAADDPDCFHTHPAYAFRLILRGGYIEQLPDNTYQILIPGSFGIVRPDFCHRIDELVDARGSYSLWIRFRKCAPVILRGDGWKQQEQTYRVEGTILESSHE